MSMNSIEQEFVRICREGYVFLVNHFIQSKEIDIHHNDCEAFYETLLYGRFETFKLFIETGEFTDYDKYLDKTLSSKYPSTDIILYLMDVGARLDNIKNSNDIPFLFYILRSPSNNLDSTVKVIQKIMSEYDLSVLTDVDTCFYNYYYSERCYTSRDDIREIDLFDEYLTLIEDNTLLRVLTKCAKCERDKDIIVFEKFFDMLKPDSHNQLIFNILRNAYVKEKLESVVKIVKDKGWESNNEFLEQLEKVYPHRFNMFVELLA